LWGTQSKQFYSGIVKPFDFAAGVHHNSGVGQYCCGFPEAADDIGQSALAAVTAFTHAVEAVVDFIPYAMVLWWFQSRTFS